MAWSISRTAIFVVWGWNRPIIDQCVGSNASVDVDSARRGIHKMVRTWKFPTQARTKYQFSA